VVVLSYGNGGAREVVRQLVDEGADTSRIILVHNPSPAVPAPPPVDHGVTVLVQPDNLGYGAGMNVGRKLALSRDPTAVVVLLTHDVEIAYADIARLAREIRTHPVVGILAPRLQSPAGSSLSAGGTLDRFGNVRHLATHDRVGTQVRDWVDGAVVALSPLAPTLPSQYFLYMDDVALSTRTWRAGLEVRVDLSIVAVTEPKAADRRDVFRFLYWRNRLAFARTELTLVATIVGLLRLVGAAFLRSAQTTARERSIRSGARLLRLYARAARDGLGSRLGPVEIETVDLSVE
jgi:GT2 family glycosyltransferase